MFKGRYLEGNRTQVTIARSNIQANVPEGSLTFAVLTDRFGEDGEAAVALLRNWPFCYCHDLFRVHPYNTLRNKTKEGYHWHVKWILFSLNIRMILKGMLRNCFDMSGMSLGFFGIYENVVKKNENVHEISQDVTDKSLEDSVSISQVKSHHKVLKISQRFLKCHLPLIPLLNLSQIVSASNVQIGDGGIMKLFINTDKEK